MTMAAALPSRRFREIAGRAASVDAVWSWTPGEATFEIIPADGAVDLIMSIDANGACLPFVHVPTVRAHRAEVHDNEIIVGVRLRVGFGAPLVARAEVVTRVAAQRTQRAADLDEIGCALEGAVSDVLEALGPPPALVRDFIALTKEGSGTARLGGRSALRSLERAARTWIGVTPKALMRIERAHAARRHILRGQAFCDVAAELCFSDQAHLTRELRTLLGVTPREALRVANLQDGEGSGR